MAVSQEYLDFVLDQLQGVGEITHKRMFGGVGLYSERVFFGLIADDVLYFKVDDSNRPDYDAAGMEPFRPYGKDSYAMSYYQVPIEVLEDPAELRPWVDKAMAVAMKASSKKKPARKKTQPGGPHRKR